MEALTDRVGQAETCAAVIATATQALAAAGVGNPRLDAEVLLAAACGLDRTALYSRTRELVPPRCRDAFGGMLTRRLAREPLQYIFGRQEFWSLTFAVTPDVLIPRPETELLVDEILATASLTICDLGTGSGCIAVALAHELPRAQVWGLDISPAALDVAAANARRHGVADRIRFVESNLFAAVGGVRFDAIVCNPPYVGSAELECVQPELRWEPSQALDGGPDGLDVVRRVVADAPSYLAPNGHLLMEIGMAQGAAVAALARAAGFAAVTIRPDYAGLPRVLVAQR